MKILKLKNEQETEKKVLELISKGIKFQTTGRTTIIIL